jgi:predicted alpha/beta hydrolase
VSAATPVSIPARDAYALGGSVYELPGTADDQAVVVIASATAVRRRYYDPFAGWLADRGFRVVTFDYRGIGDSRPRRLRGFQARMREWGEQDLSGVIEWAAARWPRSPLLLVGHSVGGQLVGLTDNVGRLRAVLTVGAQSGYWRHWVQGTASLRMAFNWYVLIPGVAHLFGYVPGFLGIGEDLPRGVALEWSAWGRKPRYLLDGYPEREVLFARYGGAFRAYSFSDDPYAPRAAVDALLAFYRNARTEHVHQTPGDLGVRTMGHFGFFRDRFRDSLWLHAARWLEGQARAAGPGEAAKPACYPALGGEEVSA